MSKPRNRKKKLTAQEELQRLRAQEPVVGLQKYCSICKKLKPAKSGVDVRIANMIGDYYERVDSMSDAEIWICAEDATPVQQKALGFSIGKKSARNPDAVSHEAVSSAGVAKD